MVISENYEGEEVVKHLSLTLTQQSVTKILTVTNMNLEILKAGAKNELLFNKLTCDFQLGNICNKNL